MRTTPLLIVTLVSALLIFAGLSATADNHTNWGPELGSSLPATLSAQTHHGDNVQLSKLATDNGLAIAFVRSADWCPFCKRQMIELNKSREEFAKRGVTLAVLSYDSAEILHKFAQKQDIGYTLLSDSDSTVINAFGIRNEKHEKGSSGYGIPHPGIMVFDASGTLIAKFAEEGYRKRPPIDGVLAAIDKKL